MHTMYEKVVSVIAKPVEDRTDIECMDLVAWFRNKSSLFQSLKAGKDNNYIFVIEVIFLRLVFSRTYFHKYPHFQRFRTEFQNFFC